MFTQEAIAGYIGTGIWTLINLFVIYWVLNRFLFKPFAGIIAKRQKLIQDQLDDAAEKSRLASKHEAETKQRMAESMKQAADIVNEAVQKAQAQEAEILKEAKEESQGILERTTEESKRIRNNMYVDMRREIADLSVAIASKVIGSTLSKSEQSRLVDQFLEEEVQKRQAANETQGEEA